MSARMISCTAMKRFRRRLPDDARGAGVRRGARAHATSLAVAVAAFAALSGLTYLVFRDLEERAALVNRNDMEKILNGLFAGLGDHDDFGAAIEASASLQGMIQGIGVYDGGGRRTYSWGDAPETFVLDTAHGAMEDGFGRTYLEDPKKDAIMLVFRPGRMGPPPPQGEGPREGDASRAAPPAAEPPQGEKPPRERSPFFEVLRGGDTALLAVRQSAFFGAQRVRRILFPIVEAALLALVVFVRTLILRNAEYRRRIEEQKSLVILGTAAGTLAHEIKNPLLAIRLQTGILERTVPAQARRELAIINAEIERLSALTYRVNDYLREPEGHPSPFDPVELVREVGFRALGRDVVAAGFPGGLRIRMDPERLRSTLENLLRNAVESGGPEGEIRVELSRGDGRVVLDVLDRGRGVPAADREKVFQPFYTTKSRGTGIGLAICRRFVEAAGGRISIEERSGGGARVAVRIPEDRGSAAEDRA